MPTREDEANEADGAYDQKTRARLQQRRRETFSIFERRALKPCNDWRARRERLENSSARCGSYGLAIAIVSYAQEYWSFVHGTKLFRIDFHQMQR